MDRIRTLYLDSAYAEETNNGFQYNVTGGVSVPEGSRVYVDNISCLLYTSPSPRDS